MKWRPAKLNTRASALTLIVLVSVACGYSLFTYKGKLKQVREVRQQFGFYDLKLSRNELYEAKIKTTGNKVVSTFSNPAYPNFLLKGNFVQNHQLGGKHYFAFTPVFHNLSKEQLLLINYVDQLMNAQVWMQQIEPDGVPLVTMQNGMIFHYPLEQH